MGGAYEKVTRGATVEHVHYIRGGGDVAAIQKKTVGAGTETRYLHRDHLGSVVAATDATGAVLERYSFDAWGKRRDPATWLTPAVGTFSLDPAFNDRGYTGHEHIDHLGLVNMNGRVYDPEIGRFLSADPFVQFPESTQSYNRYSYVGNNPLSYTDPSGFFSFRQAFQVLGILMSIFIPTGITLLWEKMLWGFASGFAASGGDLKAATLGALGGAMFHGIGNLSKLGPLARATMHGIASGVLSELGGGKFQSGFAGGFFGNLSGAVGAKMFGPNGSGGTLGAIKRTITAAIGGGLGSAAGGGKFKNGAITAALAQMFNGETHAAAEKKEIGEVPGYDQDKKENAWRKQIDEVILDEVEDYNTEFGYKAGDDGYIDAKTVKAWAMMESGSHRDAFLEDPLQVNNAGDWDKSKTRIAGLTKNEIMTPNKSIYAGLRWWRYKGMIHDDTGTPVEWRGNLQAFIRYNAAWENPIHQGATRCTPHPQYYAERILSLRNGM